MCMDWKLFAQLLVTLVVALASGWLGHGLAARRDLVNERRKLRVAYLLEAYRKLEDAGNRSDAAVTWPKFESAIADIQLLGSLEQVRLARTFALDMAQHHTASLDPLIHDLRHSLRRELELPATKENVVYLRIAGGGAVSFDQTLSATAQSVGEAKIEGAALAAPLARKQLDQHEDVSGFIGQIVVAWQELESIVRQRLGRVGGIDLAGIGASELLDRAFGVDAVTRAQRDSLRGLLAMRNLAVHSPGGNIDPARAGEFLNLAEAMKMVLETS